MLNTANYSNNMVGNLEYGYKMFEGKTFVMARVDVKMPFTQGTFDEGNSVQTGLYRDNSSFISPGLKIAQKLADAWFLNFGVYGAFFSENEGSAATYNFGLAYEW